MLNPAPNDTATPTKNAPGGRPVTPAGAKIGASVETEPSMRPSRAGCTSCSTNFGCFGADLARIFTGTSCGVASFPECFGHESWCEIEQLAGRVPQQHAAIRGTRK